ncbi:MAG: response regulator [Chloroflexota bacterium]|nr:response regulator [Chloroflexota bacterium]
MAEQTREILIVESDEPTAELYQRELSRDYNVMICDDRQTALELLRTRTISAVVLEPALDGEQGWILLESIKQADRTRSIPVILCSTHDERRRGMRLGADAYLVKPTLPITLRHMLRQVTKLD